MSCSTHIVGTKSASGAVVGCSSRPFHTKTGTYHVSGSLALPTLTTYLDSEYFSSKYVSLRMRDGSSGRLEDVGGRLLARLQE